MKSIYYLFVLILLAGCSKEPLEELGVQQDPLAAKNAIAQKGNPHEKFKTPSVTQSTWEENSLELVIVPAEGGATGGLSIRWMTEEDYEAYGWNNDLGGHVLLNGNASDEYSLEEGDEFIFSLEDFITGEGEGWNRALECGQSYLIIVQALQDGSTQKSSYSDPEEFSTADCEVVDDPCNFLDILKEVCSQDINNPTLQGFTAWFNAQLSLNHIPKNGNFNPTISQLLEEYNAFEPAGIGTLTTEYTFTAGDCGQVTIEISAEIKHCAE